MWSKFDLKTWDTWVNGLGPGFQDALYREPNEETKMFEGMTPEEKTAMCKRAQAEWAKLALTIHQPVEVSCHDSPLCQPAAATATPVPVEWADKLGAAILRT
jgi:hypothetical protein